jgi:hypothetical protein
VPQKHVFPGSNPGWGTSFLREPKRSRLLFYNLDVAKQPRRAQRALGSPMGRAAGQAG